jgi:hypothetical protein
LLRRCGEIAKQIKPAIGGDRRSKSGRPPTGSHKAAALGAAAGPALERSFWHGGCAMIEVRPATVDEMVLAFLRADFHTPATDRAPLYIAVLARIGTDAALLIDRGDLNDPQQNRNRRSILCECRGALFRGFPGDTVWRLVTVTPADVKRFMYANHLENWAAVSGGTRLVAKGAKNLDGEQNKVIRGNVTGIAARLRRGERFPALIAAQHVDPDDLALIEGHNRATAYAWAGLPNEIDVLIGTSTHMDRWPFF